MPSRERPEGGTRGPKPTHSRAEIAAVAVRVADADGLDAVSMRRIATELGAGTTSLYRYVAHKDDLFTLMLEAVATAEFRPAPLDPDPRVNLRAIAHQQRDLLLRHPWAARLSPQRALFSPHGLPWLEHLFAAASTDLDPDRAIIAISTISAFVDGAVGAVLAERAAGERTGQDIDQWLAAQAPSGADIIGGGRFPALTRVMVEAELPHRPDRMDVQFEAGLECVITGVLAQRPGRVHPERTTDA